MDIQTIPLPLSNCIWMVQLPREILHERAKGLNCIALSLSEQKYTREEKGGIFSWLVFTKPDPFHYCQLRKGDSCQSADWALHEPVIRLESLSGGRFTDGHQIPNRWTRFFRGSTERLHVSEGKGIPVKRYCPLMARTLRKETRAQG